MQLNKMGLLPYEVQFKYLLDLPYDDVMNYCRTSSVASQICRSDRFWREKIRSDFGPDILQYQSPDVPAMVEYQRLNNPNLEDALLNVDLAVLELLYRQGENLTDYAVDRMAGEGSIIGLEWFRSKGIEPDRRGLTWAARMGHSEVLKWYLLNDSLSIDMVADIAIAEGLIDVLDWMRDQLGYTPEVKYIEDIEWAPHESLDWLYAHGYRPTPEEIRYVLAHDKYNLLSSFVDHGFVTPEQALQHD